MFNGFLLFSTAKKIKKNMVKAKVFIAQNTLAHIPNINSVFRGVDELLTHDGIMVTEDPYLPFMLKKDHMIKYMMSMFLFYHLNSMINICKKFDLRF